MTRSHFCKIQVETKGCSWLFCQILHDLLRSKVGVTIHVDIPLGNNFAPEPGEELIIHTGQVNRGHFAVVMSPQPHFQKGDVTVQSDMVIHGA